MLSEWDKLSELEKLKLRLSVAEKYLAFTMCTVVVFGVFLVIMAVALKDHIS